MLKALTPFVPLLLLFPGCITGVVIDERMAVDERGEVERSLTIEVMTDGDPSEAKATLEKSVLPREPEWGSVEMEKTKNGYAVRAKGRFERLRETGFDRYLRRSMRFEVRRGFPFIGYELSVTFGSIPSERRKATAELVVEVVEGELERISGPLPPEGRARLKDGVIELLKAPARDSGEVEEKIRRFRELVAEVSPAELGDEELDRIAGEVRRAMERELPRRLRERGLIGIVEHDPEHRLAVRMPGEVIETNGEISGDEVIWRVTGEDYSERPFRAYARSRKLNLPALIAAVVAGAAACAAIAILIVRRSRGEYS